jgi:hypothetical protein
MTVMQASTCQTRLHPFAQAVFWIVAAFYAYGALVHILNIASLTGFSWPEAPSKWQVLDIGYLLVDMVVVVGLVRRSWIGIAAFFLAAISQIALYTVFRDWVLNVPEVFQRSAEDLAPRSLVDTDPCLSPKAAIERTGIDDSKVPHTGHKPPDRTDAPKTVDYVTDATISRHVDKTRATNPWQNGIWF